MKTQNKIKQGQAVAGPLYRSIVRNLLVCSLVLSGLQAFSQPSNISPAKEEKVIIQPTFTKPNWWFGVAAAGNLNFYRGTTQELNSTLTSPVPFNSGAGVGLYLAPLVEYRFTDSNWGLMFQAGYDGRNGRFDKVVTPCNCVADLSTNIHYITLEPSLRFAPFKSNFYLFGGPRFAFNVSQSFTYSLDTNPAFPLQEVNPDITGDFSKMNSMVVSMQIGAGYDIPLSPVNQQWQTILSPFISFQPYMGQDPRSIETWTVTTLRIGAALKFGRGTPIPPVQSAPLALTGVDPNVNFLISSPDNIVGERRVQEIFPLRNYVFFDLGSTEIPDRYVLLTKAQVKDFMEDRLETFTPKRLSGRSDREMIVYYNVLNILGDRMGSNPGTVVRLAGASMQGKNEGKAMAETVKSYLVTVFGISPARMNTEGRIKPRIPSEQPGATKDLTLLREGDRRVSIWSESPALMMEYQTGPKSPLKEVALTAVQEAPVDSYVTFTANGAKEAFSSWTLQIKDEEGKVRSFGPYTQERVSLPGKVLLDSRPEGNFTATMVGNTKSGKVVQKEAPVHIVLWKPAQDEQGIRYSVIFEFNDSKAIETYRKYLTDVVTPKIPIGGKVYIHGHTDITGDEDHNYELSLARSNEVKSILESALSKAGRTDVTFVVHGFGEDQGMAPFENNFPEERFYNRSVIIDIIPKNK